MSESNMEQEREEMPDASDNEDERISWDEAMEDLERQKQMIKENERTNEPLPQQEKPLPPPATREGGGPPPNLKFILDIPLQVTVELGRKRLLIHDLLQLSQGSVIELTKQLGEPFEVMVNQKLIARGEVVVINDRFGVRITDIISPLERVHRL